jgi:hypothetical protein
VVSAFGVFISHHQISSPPARSQIGDESLGGR